MADDTWAGLAEPFADDAYASVKGRVRTYVMHQQLLEHLPPRPAPVLDVGGGAGQQSFPLAQAGYDVRLGSFAPMTRLHLVAPKQRRWLVLGLART